MQLKDHCTAFIVLLKLGKAAWLVYSLRYMCKEDRTPARTSVDRYCDYDQISSIINHQAASPTGRETCFALTHAMVSSKLPKRVIRYAHVI